jgi:hypothetical protein
MNYRWFKRSSYQVTASELLEPFKYTMVLTPKFTFDASAVVRHIAGPTTLQE